MAESMTVETILEADWQLKGFWTKTRFLYKGAKGGYSDVDLLAYHPLAKHLVIGESKAHGPKNRVFAYTEKSLARDSEMKKVLRDDYLGFIKNLPRVCNSELIFGQKVAFEQMVEVLTVQLVSNFYFSKGVKTQVEEHVRGKILAEMDVKTVHVRLETAIDVFARLIKSIGESNQGKRYGHPVLDLARELYRYSHPAFVGAGSSKERQKAAEEVLSDFYSALKD